MKIRLRTSVLRAAFLLVLIFTSVRCHWINLHVWYEELSDQEPAGFLPLQQNDTRLSRLQQQATQPLMQQDASVGGGPQEMPNALYFHQPRPLPPCDQLPGLTQAQVEICTVFSDHMRSVVHGAKLGLSECRWQFRHHHWNCSSPPSAEDGRTMLASALKTIKDKASTLARKSVNNSILQSENYLNALLKLGSKEVAFAHSVWSAAATHAVARSCRDGSLSSCGCGKTARPADLKEEWRWGGCGDNLQYGYKFASDFVDSREKEKFSDRKLSAKALVNLHNNEAGRRAVLKKTKIACKCHGVSGSCALVTCWHQVPSFRDIGDTLKVRYKEATLVKMNRRGRLQVKRSTDKIPSVHDLVYLETSPNYCVHNESLGVPGPSGRICNRTSSGPDGCKSLCCSKGFSTTVSKTSTRCHCKFIWCCHVVCQECKKVEKVSACK